MHSWMPVCPSIYLSVYLEPVCLTPVCLSVFLCLNLLRKKLNGKIWGRRTVRYRRREQQNLGSSVIFPFIAKAKGWHRYVCVRDIIIRLACVCLCAGYHNTHVWCTCIHACACIHSAIWSYVCAQTRTRHARTHEQQTAYEHEQQTAYKHKQHTHIPLPLDKAVIRDHKHLLIMWSRNFDRGKSPGWFPAKNSLIWREGCECLRDLHSRMWLCAHKGLASQFMSSCVDRFSK